MAMDGADVAQLRTLAAQLATGAERLDATAKALHSLINGATQWRVRTRNGSASSGTARPPMR
jgi:hypothetical protein